MSGNKEITFSQLHVQDPGIPSTYPWAGGCHHPTGMPGQEECHSKQTFVFIVTIERNRLLKKRMTMMLPEKVTNVPSRSCCFFMLAAPGQTAQVMQLGHRTTHFWWPVQAFRPARLSLVRPHIPLPGMWWGVFVSSGSLLLQVSKNTLQKAEPESSVYCCVSGRCLTSNARHGFALGKVVEVIHVHVIKNNQVVHEFIN